MASRPLLRVLMLSPRASTQMFVTPRPTSAVFVNKRRPRNLDITNSRSTIALHLLHLHSFQGAHPLLLITMNTLSIRAFIPPLTRRAIPLRATRCYAVQAPGAPTVEIFSQQHKWMQKERAARDVEASRGVDYLRDEVASRLCERLLVCVLAPHKQSISNDLGHQSPFPTRP